MVSPSMPCLSTIPSAAERTSSRVRRCAARGGVPSAGAISLPVGDGLVLATMFILSQESCSVALHCSATVVQMARTKVQSDALWLLRREMKQQFERKHS